MLDVLINPLKAFAEQVIGALGYWGIGLLMLLDSANIPIPSEAVMPAGGFVAARGEMNIFWVGFAGSVGTVLGSIFNYWLGYRLGTEGLAKYGKYLLIRQKEVEHGELWFHKHGVLVTLWGRFIPLVRTFISLPAGIYRMNFPLFVLYAILGATPWCYGWAWLGFKMHQNWDAVEKNWHYVDYVVVIVLAYFLIKFLRYRFAKNGPSEDESRPA